MIISFMNIMIIPYDVLLLSYFLFVFFFSQALQELRREFERYERALCSNDVKEPFLATPVVQAVVLFWCRNWMSCFTRAQRQFAMACLRISMAMRLW